MSLLQSFVALPDATQAGISFVVVALVGLLFNYIGGLLPFTSPFLAKYKEEISLACSAFVVGWIQNILPAAYPEISVLVVQLILAALASAGLFKVLGKAGVRGFVAG